MAIYRIDKENPEVFYDEHFSREIRMSKLYDEETLEKLKKKMIYKFRCLDDDGIVYFEGVCSSNESFIPLWNIGEDYGCTDIQYKNGRKWESL